MTELRVASWNKLGAGSWKRAGSWNSVSHELRAAAAHKLRVGRRAGRFLQIF
jgi:hypothetical protein